MSGYILEADGIEYRYPDGTWALKGVTCAVKEGKKVAFLGCNGAGKSTLFMHFNGLLQPQKGLVRFAGEKVTYDRHTLAELRRQVGLVFQDPDSQLFSANVWEEISFGPLNLGLTAEETRSRVQEVLHATGLWHLRDRPVHALSLGQKKLVTVADILAMRPVVLIADEPTAYLDPATASRIMDLLDRVNREGTTVVISTHDVDLAYAWADHIFMLDAGVVSCGGPPPQFFSDREMLEATGFPLPWVLEVSSHLKLTGQLRGETVPRTRGELINAIRHNGAVKGECTMERAIVILGHGSRASVGDANKVVMNIAEMVRTQLHVPILEVAFMNRKSGLQTLHEAIAKAVEAGAREVIVAPVFITKGQHLREDIPQEISAVQAAYGGRVQVKLASHLGEDPRLAQVVMDRIREAL